jgi:acetyl/propionyl-CoA carboxylase alpha subunit
MMADIAGHIGRWFLAENEHFVLAVINSGFILICPLPEVIRIMGGKKTECSATEKSLIFY